MAPKSSPVLEGMPSLIVEATDFERNAFDHFRQTTIRQMYLDTPRARMTQLVLQMSSSDPVFRAAAALGSVHRSLVCTTPGTPHQAVTWIQDALVQYGRAVASLQRSIADLDSGQATCIEPILCACILLASCEVMKSDTMAALSHLRFGRRISLEQDSKHAGEERPYTPQTKSVIVSMFEQVEQKYLATEGDLVEDLFADLRARCRRRSVDC